MTLMRVCIYGGTHLEETGLGAASAEFIRTLAYQVLDSMPAIIVTGGFLKSTRDPDAVSTDSAALDGARRFAVARGRPLEECFEACIPEPSLDGRLEIGGVVRMSGADGVKLRVLAGRTPLGRRLAMIAGVDLLVTISGRQHTEVVVEQALELGIPVLPIPDAGGDSADMLKNHRAQIAATFAPGGLDTCLAELSRSIRGNPEAAAVAVISLLTTAKIGKCLVLLPYDLDHNRLYDVHIEPAVAEYMHPVRLDRLPASSAIYTSFADAVRTATAIVADITRINENVMYEIGYTHGQGLTPLMYTQDKARIDALPVYFKTLNVKYAKEPEDVARLIGSYLQSVKSNRAVRSVGWADD